METSAAYRITQAALSNWRRAPERHMVNTIAVLTNTPSGPVYAPPDVSGLKRQDGSPAQPGDILSGQPDGTLQTRPASEPGAWEVVTVQGPYFAYAGNGQCVILVLPPGL